MDASQAFQREPGVPISEYPGVRDLGEEYDDPAESLHEDEPHPETDQPDPPFVDPILPGMDATWGSDRFQDNYDTRCQALYNDTYREIFNTFQESTQYL